MPPSNEIGLALAPLISAERVLQEVAQHLLRSTAWDSVAIALANEDTGVFSLAQHSGFAANERDGIEHQFGERWLDAAQSRAIVSGVLGDGIEVTVPMVRDARVVGAFTLSSTSAPTSQQLNEIHRALTDVAAQAAAAIERARIVKRLEHRRRLEAIAEVSAGIAHELRNPLFGISSAAQLLRFRVKDDPVVEKNIGRVLREVERLNSMVTSLLEYGRPAPVRLQAGDPDAVWDEVLATLRGRLESRALLVNRSRATPAAALSIDPQQLSQVFVNILENATDAAPESTDLTLNSSALPNGGWRCQLRNGGAAIPPETLPRVFELFFSTKPRGSGIGLALCQRIIEDHGGTLTLESSAESGTVATVVLPPLVQ
jgi:signal transduction histidine kinase